MVTATASVAPRPPAASWDEAGPGESPAAVRGRGGGQGEGTWKGVVLLRVTSPPHMKSVCESKCLSLFDPCPMLSTFS